MKKSFLLLFIPVLMVSFIQPLQLFKTSLKVTVRNDLGNTESGAQVSLYKSKEDYQKSQNAVATKITDEKGNVLFTDLEAIVYYMSAEKGDKNNFDAGEKTDALLPEKINKVTVIISE